MAKNIFIATGLFILGASSILYILDMGGDKNRLFENLLYLSAPILTVFAAAFIVRTYGFSSKHGRAFFLIFLGYLSWLIGETLWVVFDYVLGIDPYPSIADFFFLTAYPLIALGIIFEVKLADIKFSSINRAILITFGVLTTLLVIGVTYSELILAYVPGGSLYDNLALVYGFASLILVIPAMLILPLAWEFKGGKIFIPWLLIFIGLFLDLLGDTLYGVFLEPYLEGLNPYELVDLLWIGEYVLVAFGLAGIAFVIRDIQKRFVPK